MRILFCNIAWMDYYKGTIEGKDVPRNGGSYVALHNDAHESYVVEDGANHFMYFCNKNNVQFETVTI